MSRTPIWFAVVENGFGYALDAYPEERVGYLRELGRSAKGEFATRQEATARVKEVLNPRRPRATRR